MIKRLTNKNSYKVNNYMVTIERVKNNVYGNPRYKATLINLDCNNPDNYYYTACYTFTGHYYNELDEVKFIVNYHNKKNN